MLVEGERYTREEIHNALGGETQHYLPTVGGCVVCGCFRSDTNPDAPDVVLAGSGPVIRQKAHQFCRQRAAVPIFIKRASGAWEYVGDYQVTGSSESPEDIAAQSLRSGRGDISIILYLEKAA